MLAKEDEGPPAAMDITDSLPAMKGFGLPGEWAAHERAFMVWPSRPDRWADMTQAFVAFGQVARAVSLYEPVVVIAHPSQAAEAQLCCGPDIDVVAAEVEESRARDMLPCFLLDDGGTVGGVVFRLNGWGAKPHRDKDGALAIDVLDRLDMGRWHAPLVLEAGAVQSDGQGTLLASEACLLDASRNPTLDKAQVEERLCLFLGARKIIWLDPGLGGIIPDGHLSGWVRFAGPGRLVMNADAPPGDPRRAVIRALRDQLRGATDARGRALEVVDLTLPAWTGTGPGDGAPVSYLGYYVANDGVLVPSFDDPADDEAARIIQSLYPGRDLLQVPARVIADGGLCLAAILREQPAGPALALD